MKPPFILGIDPGLGGALALLDTRIDPDTPPAHAVYDMPTFRPAPKAKVAIDARVLADLVGELAFNHQGMVAVIENVNSRPRQAGAFSFGLSTGIVHGVLAAHGVPTTLVAPSEWKPAMGLSLGEDAKGDSKRKARLVAVKLFPDLAEQFARVKDDGRAEALLLALYFANRPIKGARRG